MKYYPREDGESGFQIVVCDKHGQSHTIDFDRKGFRAFFAAMARIYWML